MKNFLVLMITLAICLLLYSLRNEIIVSIYKYAYKNSVTIIDNDYSSDFEFGYLKKTNDFTPKNKQELINVLYTIIDSETSEFAIFCDYECIDDANEILNDQTTLPAINTFVHPYNAYERITFSNTGYNIIIVDITKQYNGSEIFLVENELNKIEQQIKANELVNYDKILAMHNYIINNTKYEDALEYGKASDLIIHKKARCSAYTDLMSIYLYRLNIPNYRIASKSHIWNYLKLDGKWLHMDLTWDDPVLNNGQQILLDDFFLIDTNKLMTLDTNSHNYNKNIYLEAK